MTIYFVISWNKRSYICRAGRQPTSGARRLLGSAHEQPGPRKQHLPGSPARPSLAVGRARGPRRQLVFAHSSWVCRMHAELGTARFAILLFIPSQVYAFFSFFFFYFCFLPFTMTIIINLLITMDFVKIHHRLNDFL